MIQSGLLSKKVSQECFSKKELRSKGVKKIVQVINRLSPVHVQVRVSGFRGSSPFVQLYRDLSLVGELACGTETIGEVNRIPGTIPSKQTL